MKNIKKFNDFNINEEENGMFHHQLLDVYVVTVDLAIPVSTEFSGESGYVEDAVSAALSENLQTSGAILDWQYRDGGYYSKKALSNISADNYIEGDAFNHTIF
jgi:hypothetical protein